MNNSRISKRLWKYISKSLKNKTTPPDWIRYRMNEIAHIILSPLNDEKGEHFES